MPVTWCDLVSCCQTLLPTPQLAFSQLPQETSLLLQSQFRHFLVLKDIYISLFVPNLGLLPSSTYIANRVLYYFHSFCILLLLHISHLLCILHLAKWGVSSAQTIVLILMLLASINIQYTVGLCLWRLIFKRIKSRVMLNQGGFSTFFIVNAAADIYKSFHLMAMRILTNFSPANQPFQIHRSTLNIF